MLDSDKKQFAKLVRVTMLVCGGDAPEPDVLRIWWGALQRFDISDVSVAFGQYVQHGKYSPKPADILEILDRIKPDGRPGADEAWAMIPRDEAISAVMTNEMSEALGIAQPLLDEGDQVAARMAFKEAYQRIVDTAKRAGEAPKWFPSLGHDKEGRESVLADAVRLGRISADHAIRLMPPDKVAPMLEMAGEQKLALEYKPTPTEKAKENLARLKMMLAKDGLLA